MIQTLQAAADLDPLAIARVVALALSISLVLAFLQNAIRDATWSVFNFVAAIFAFLCRALLTFVNFLSARSWEALDGLAEEGTFPDRRSKPWVGWFIVGPAVYCVLMFLFMASDLTVAILIFEAMGLTLGGATTSAISFIPLENAMGVIFVALAVFWGIVLFDLWNMTPFSYIWSKMEEVPRRRLVIVVLTCLTITILTGLLMGIWSQAQLKGGLPEPWQTVLPWIIRGDLVALLITATAVAGKPFGSAITALWVVVLLVLRAISSVLLVVMRFILFLVRAFIHIPLTIVALLAFIGHKLWNWMSEFGWAKRALFKPITTTVVDANALGGESEQPLTFDPRLAVANANKARMRHLYEAVFPAFGADLEDYFAADVLHTDLEGADATGLGPLRQRLRRMRDGIAGLEIKVLDQAAEDDRVYSTLLVTGTQERAVDGAIRRDQAVRLSALETVHLREGKVIQRDGLFRTFSSAVAPDRETATIGS
ncbi:MAG: ester cyclase [Chloroflexi bacterium]|nr:ester cyclase [Chloroflexota bacterium]